MKTVKITANDDGSFEVGEDVGEMGGEGGAMGAQMGAEGAENGMRMVGSFEEAMSVAEGILMEGGQPKGESEGFMSVVDGMGKGKQGAM